MYNFSKKISSLLIIIIVLTLVTPNNVKAEVASIIDKSQLEKGIITITYEPKAGEVNKVQIVKDDVKYLYSLQNNNNRFPLSLGDGTYTILVLKLVKGNSYSVIEQESVELQLKNEEEPFLQSIQLINWNTNMDTVKKAKELTKKSKTDLDKVTTIYKYVINNISYDNAKAKSVKLDYIPVVDNVLDSSKGICYDYASLVAAMLRSIGVPTKLVMGYNKSDATTYHAWNQVYLADEGKWITIDTTYDASSSSHSTTANMLKDAKKYSASKVY
ncbi:MAG: transglutaminase-like enzyme putative cysteine protease [Anaerocolumna sp.]|jgi:transglutaminase-like putative cysteine protease|nr:transglutaminase-like enzyme putative cysteine protease [Anaerocolumna sp.]